MGTKESVATSQPKRTCKGFLHMVCKKCGETKTFNTREKIDRFYCQGCGNVEVFGKPLRRAFLNCECGMNSRYLTNAESEVIEIECVNCEQPVALDYKKKHNVYQTIKCVD